MKNPKQVRILAAALALCGVAAVAASPLLRSTVAAQDRNHDGRPDVWRKYDANGAVAEVAIDTNFDSRVDVEEFYERGRLIERDIDRDFDDRIDVKQTFDPSTELLTRSVVDSDGDGTADLLVLFDDGQPVYSTWLSAGLIPQATDDDSDVRADGLEPLRDVFAAQASVHDSSSRPNGERVATATSIRGLLSDLRSTPPGEPRSFVAPAHTNAPSAPDPSGRFSRGPPLSRPSGVR